MFSKVYQTEVVRALPLNINIIGTMLTLKNIFTGSQLHTYAVPSAEITQYLYERRIVITNDIRELIVLVDTILGRLEKLDLVIKLTVKDALEAGVKDIPPRAKCLYVLSKIGENLLRYIYPYLDLYNEALLPVSMIEASKDMRSMLGRKNLFSKKTMRKMCLTLKCGRQELVLKRVENQIAVEFFPDFPQIDLENLIAFMKVRGIELNDELLKILEEVYSNGEKVEWPDLAAAFKNRALKERRSQKNEANKIRKDKAESVLLSMGQISS